jgi:hypothetical protein
MTQMHTDHTRKTGGLARSVPPAEPPFFSSIVVHPRHLRMVSYLFVSCWSLCLGGHLFFLPNAVAVDLPFGDGTVIRFAEVRQGVEALTRRDDYIRQLSPFDRQVRPKSDRDVSEPEFLAFIAGHVLPWTEDDIRKLTPHLVALEAKLRPWKLKLPPIVLLVKTSGREEGGAAYCRGPAIVLPQNMIDGPPEQLEKVLPHETFHVLSSHNPALRDALYQIIGFKACNEVLLPEPLRARKITNPDAPVNDHYITVMIDGRAAELMPVLYSKTDRFDAQRGGTVFTYLQFKLMELQIDAGVRRPALRMGQPVLLDPASVPGFREQIGGNTSYIIHPEEILAENFVHLLNGRINLPTPRVVEEMGRVLQEGN